MADTAKYKFIKPTVGGSENAWGGNLNDNFDKLDDLLGGEQPVNGINIESGTIDGSLITGEIGGTDPDNPTSIHPDTEISGKVKSLVGMDDPDGTITNVEVTARQIEIEGRIVEGTPDQIENGTSATFSPDNGTMQAAIITANETHTYNLVMPVAGMSLTLILDKKNKEATNVVWEHGSAANANKWVGGGEPDLNEGINIIQFFT